MPKSETSNLLPLNRPVKRQEQGCWHAVGRQARGGRTGRQTGRFPGAIDGEMLQNNRCFSATTIDAQDATGGDYGQVAQCLAGRGGRRA